MAEPWCIDILKAVMAATPHKWSQQTLASFPPSLQEYYRQQQTGMSDFEAEICYRATTGCTVDKYQTKVLMEKIWVQEMKSQGDSHF